MLLHSLTLRYVLHWTQLKRTSFYGFYRDYYLKNGHPPIFSTGDLFNTRKLCGFLFILNVCYMCLLKWTPRLEDCLFAPAKNSAAAKPPFSLGPVQEEFWKYLQIFSQPFQFKHAEKTWHFFPANRFKMCQVTCGQWSLESEVQLWTGSLWLSIFYPQVFQYENYSVLVISSSGYSHYCNSNTIWLFYSA